MHSIFAIIYAKKKGTLFVHTKQLQQVKCLDCKPGNNSWLLWQDDVKIVLMCFYVEIFEIHAH